MEESVTETELKKNKEYIINPDAKTILVPKSKLIVIGRPEEIKKLNELF